MHTQKSFKDKARDKPKHSLKDHCVAKKGGAGGKGSWGHAKDDVKFMDEDGHALDQNDPNFDPADQNESGYKLQKYTPSEANNKFFANSMSDLSTFKKKVRDACAEYLVSHDTNEFLVSIKDAKFTLYHQDLPAILIKYSLDKEDKDRVKISQMLHQLHKDNLVTTSQMTQGFAKLFHGLDELQLDAPNARVILSEFVGHATAAGYVDVAATAAMEKEALELADPSTMTEAKKAIKDAVEEYLSSNELGELRTSVKEIKTSMMYEVVKQLISRAMDGSDYNREQTNVALAALTGTDIPQGHAIKGATILLNRVEDIYLDVPDVYRLLSCLVARMISDEVLPPSFLLRLDLAESDMGFHVAKQAQHLLDQASASWKLENVWGQAKD